MAAGEKIQAARKKAGLTQAQLGEKLGVSGAMIGQWENNLRNPKSETIIKIASALNVSIDELSTETFYVDPERLKNYAIKSEETSNAIAAYFAEFSKASEESNKQAYEFPIMSEEFLYQYNTVQILFYFSMLNDEGKHEAVKRIMEMSEIPKYKRTEPISPISESTDTPDQKKPSEGQETPPDGK